jgi:anti-sigma factor RsiW
VNPCPEFEPLLAERATGDLGPAERARLDAHLAGCAACAADLAATERALDLARLPPVSAEERAAVTGLARGVAAAYDRAARRRSVVRRAAAGAVALAAAVAAVLVPVVATRHPPRAVPTASDAAASAAPDAPAEGDAVAQADATDDLDQLWQDSAILDLDSE